MTALLLWWGLPLVLLVALCAIRDVGAFVIRAREDRAERARAEVRLAAREEEVASLRALLGSAIEDGRRQAREILEPELEARRSECRTLFAALEVRGRQVDRLETQLREGEVQRVMEADLAASRSAS